jgi:hypothetical protein
MVITENDDTVQIIDYEGLFGITPRLFPQSGTRNALARQDIVDCGVRFDGVRLLKTGHLG